MKSIDFDHNDKSYSLRFDFNAMARYEREMGETMSQFVDGFEGRGSVDISRTITIIWASLNSRLTVESVGDMIQQMGFSKASLLAVQAVNQALELLNSDPSLPKAEKKAGAEAGNGKSED